MPHRVLLIAPKFFGYEQEIFAEIIRLGMRVDFLPDRPFEKAFMKALMRFLPSWCSFQLSNSFFIKKIRAFKCADYSIILIIQGEGITPRILAMLRNKYPKAKMIFYTWDSIENKPKIKRNLRYYDQCFTFDPEDAKAYGMKFRPLFFSPGFDKPNSDSHTYDLSFIGTVHSDRYRIVHLLIKQLPPEKRVYIYLYLQAPWMYDLRRIFTNTLSGANRNSFKFSPLSKDVVQEVFFASRSILDIEHPGQRGATMRTFEAIGSHRKLITTNVALQDYDFYNPRNILIIDRYAPKLDSDFLNTSYEPLPEEIRSRYSIKAWVQDVIST